MRPTNIPSRPHTYTRWSAPGGHPAVRVYERRRARMCGRARAPTCNRLLIKFEWLMPQKHIKTWMSTDENLVARNQETAEANGLAAAHTRADGTYSSSASSSSSSSSSSSFLPFALRAPAPGAVALSFAIGCPSKYNYAKNTRRLLYPPPGGTRVWSHTATETAPYTRLAFVDRFFQTIDESTSKIAGCGPERLIQTWFS